MFLFAFNQELLWPSAGRGTSSSSSSSPSSSSSKCNCDSRSSPRSMEGEICTHNKRTLSEYRRVRESPKVLVLAMRHTGQVG